MPKRLSLFITRTALSLTALFLTFMPLATFADTAAPSGVATPVCTAPIIDQPGVHKPMGADAGTYVYNCTTNLWENDHYTFDPLTDVTTAKDPAVYTYNPSTGKYDTTAWLFNAPTNVYAPVSLSAVQPPAGATVIGGPAPVVPTPGSSSITNTGPGSDNTITNNGAGGTNSINQTGPNSTNTLGGSGSNSLNLNNLTNVGVANLVSGQATTGNSTVLGNTTGGSAATGNAQDLATIVNMLQSSSNALGGNTITFVRNINGDVNGDLLLDPASLGAIQPANNGSPTGNNNLTLNNTTNATLNNNINLNAASGAATVADNTSAGNATTGSASAVANIVNLINSAITSGQSFIGVININGNLNGDILLPPNFIDQLVASNVPTVNVNIGNTGPSSNNTVNSTGSNNTNVTNTNNAGITNNIQSAAASGTANVADNTSAGNATTGSAGTNITAFNLTGSRVVGSNALLVFVNVLGKWVGLIVNAPAGATAAELGGGVTTNTTAPTGNNTTNVNNTTNQQINNNVTLAAKSGDANVTQNTKAGNATSGNAKTAANLLNVENSNLSLIGWFGILFINVFGSWHGSFGINTSAGDPASSPATSNNSGSSSDGNSLAPVKAQVFRFVPHAFASSSAAGSVDTNGSIKADDVSSPTVLAASIQKAQPKTQQSPTGPRSIWKTASIIGGLTALYIAADALYTSRRSHRS
jgi:hypothetical protein